MVQFRPKTTQSFGWTWHVGISCSRKEKQTQFCINYVTLGDSSFWRKKTPSVRCYLVFEIVTRTVGGMSKGIILFSALLPVLTNVQCVGKISLPLSLHAVSQWGGRESLPSQCFQLEIGNDKQVLDLPSIPPNLKLNYIRKHAQQVQQGKLLPAEAMSKQASYGNLDKELREAQTWTSEGGWSFHCHQQQVQMQVP